MIFKLKKKQFYIIEAQRAGKQSSECKCSCHKSRTFHPPHWQIQPLYYDPQPIPCTGDPLPWGGSTICKNSRFYLGETE